MTETIHHQDLRLVPSTELAMPDMVSVANPAPSAETIAMDPGDKKPNLDTIAEELLSNIALKLGPDDFGALRLVSRAVEIKTRHEFGTTFFSSKCFMFYSHSLKALHAIAASEKLSKYLQHAYIYNASFSKRTFKCSLGPCCAAPPWIRHREAALFYHDDQKKIRESGDDRKLLATAFEELPGLHTLTVIEDLKLLPEGTDCYGLNKITRTTKATPTFEPSDPTEVQEYYTWVAHVFSTTMLAIADSGISTIARFAAVLSLPARDDAGISPLDLRFRPETIDRLATAFRNIEEFCLFFRKNWLHPVNQGSDGDVASSARAFKAILRVFAPATVVNLSLSSRGVGSIPFNTFAAQVDGSRISQLTLGKCDADMIPLVTSLSKLVVCKQLTLIAINLTDGTWIPILKVLQKLPCLEHLHLFHLREAGNDTFFIKQTEPLEPLGPVDLFEAFMHNAIGHFDESSDDEGSIREPSPLVSQMENADVDLLEMPNEQQEDEQEDEQDEEQDEEQEDVQLFFQQTQETTCYHKTRDYKAPGYESSPDKGYYICLEGEEIREEIPRFIKELNVAGDDIPDEDFDIDPNNLFPPITGQPALAQQLATLIANNPAAAPFFAMGIANASVSALAPAPAPSALATSGTAASDHATAEGTAEESDDWMEDQSDGEFSDD